MARHPGPADSESKSAMTSPSRRQFLSNAGGLTAATMAAGAVGVSSLTGVSGAVRAQTPPGQDRRARGLQIREQAARYEFRQRFPEAQSNGDEARYRPGLANFSKGLPHNKLGEVDPEAYRQLLQAIKSGKPGDFDRVPLGGAAKLVNPQAAFAFALEGADSHAQIVRTPPGFADIEFAGEMAECYWLALSRDIPYSQYGREPVTAAAIEDLKRFPAYAKVNAQTLFRGESPGVSTGPYVSQFLLQPYMFGSSPVEQRYRTTVPGLDHVTAYQSWLDTQNGNPASAGAAFDGVHRYIRNGRDLGEWVHRDFTYQGALVAALILLGYGNAALDEANPYKRSANQSGFATFGAAHVLDLIGRVANHSQKAAWYQKWVIHRRLRPEEFGGRIHNHMTGAARYPIHPSLLDSPALAAAFSKNGTYLCPQAYPEGCPTHPSFVGGTAAFMGAGVTALKAFFDESFVIPNPVVPSDDGLSLLPWKGEPLTVGGELNKLAFNVAFGRDTAGVHFRRDEVEGIVLGEWHSSNVLTDLNATYNEDFEGFGLTTFDGRKMRLNANPAGS